MCLIRAVTAIKATDVLGWEPYRSEDSSYELTICLSLSGVLPLLQLEVQGVLNYTHQ
jgi:hypothetical protein